jgi:hypothetical protein
MLESELRFRTARGLQGLKRQLSRAYSQPLVRKFTTCGLVVTLALAACGGDGDDGDARAGDGAGAGTDVIPGGTPQPGI